MTDSGRREKYKKDWNARVRASIIESLKLHETSFDNNKNSRGLRIETPATALNINLLLPVAILFCFTTCMGITIPFFFLYFTATAYIGKLKKKNTKRSLYASIKENSTRTINNKHIGYVGKGFVLLWLKSRWWCLINIYIIFSTYVSRPFFRLQPFSHRHVILNKTKISAYFVMNYDLLRSVRVHTRRTNSINKR